MPKDYEAMWQKLKIGLADVAKHREEYLRGYEEHSWAMLRDQGRLWGYQFVQKMMTDIESTDGQENFAI